MNYDAFFATALDRLKEERRYRVFADLERIAGRFRDTRLPWGHWGDFYGPMIGIR
jgi:hypothetical protein